MTFSTVTIAETYQAPGGGAAAGTVTFILSFPMSNAGVTIDTAPVSVTLDGTGAISVVLEANDDAGTSPAGTSWTVIEQISGASRAEYTIVVPSASAGQTVQLSELRPAEPGWG